jgi:hypothetical protein
MANQKSTNSRLVESVDKCLKPMERRKATPDRWYWNRRAALQQQAAEIAAQRSLSEEDFALWLSERASRINREKAA